LGVPRFDAGRVWPLGIAMQPLRFLPKFFPVLLAALSACGPYLTYKELKLQAFTINNACTQGPLTFHAQTTGARWGERLQIYVQANHTLVGRYRMKIGDKPVWDGHFASQIGTTAQGSRGPFTTYAAATKPDNARCVARPVEVQVTAAPAQSAWETPQAPEPVPAQAQPPAQGPPPPPTPVMQAHEETREKTDEEMRAEVGAQGVEAWRLQVVKWVEISAWRHYRSSGDIQVISWSIEHNEPEGQVELAANTPIEVTIWFEQPNDVSESIWFFAYEIAEPSVAEAEYIAYLQKERQERKIEAEKDAKDRTKKELERQEHCKKDPDDKENCWHEYCPRHHEDTTCWGKGGYAARMSGTQYRAQVAKLALEKSARTQQPQAPQPRQADGPPPAAQEETQPPQPSLRAQWVAGYWQWSGFAWFWLSGWWRVPDSDRIARTTVYAPVLPPPPQVEVIPPPPMANAVWIGGQWAWNGQIWLWVRGGWRFAPGVSLQWRLPRWVMEGGRVRLEPGGWVQIR